MQRGSAHLLLLLLFVIILAGGLYFYKTSSVGLTSPKLTFQKQREFIDYTNKDLGINFEYAKDLIVKTDSEEDFNKRGNGDYRKNFTGYVGYAPVEPLGAVVVLESTNSLDRQIASSAYDSNPFSVWIFDNKNNLTTQQWFDKYWYYPFMWGVFDWSSKGHIALDSEATVSGQNAEYKVVSYQPGKPKFMYVSKDNKMYLFRIIGETGEKILASFKFL